MHLRKHYGRVAKAALAGSVLYASPAAAQSVLERVLSQIDGVSKAVPVNGVYANIAESIGQPGLVSVTESVPATFENAPDDTTIWYVRDFPDSPDINIVLTRSDIGKTYSASSGLYSTELTALGIEEISIGLDGSITIKDDDSNSVATLIDVSRYSPPYKAYELNTIGGITRTLGADAVAYDLGPEVVLLPESYIDLCCSSEFKVYVDQTRLVEGPYYSSLIDGSITNTISGVTAATEQATTDAIAGIEYTLPTLNFGNIATTALGAVNTGEITLGVNSAVDEAATVKTRAVRSTLGVVGGSADTGALVLNVASNSSAVQGSVENMLIAVNGSFGNINTTALGAVNTGTITSGVNAAVAGITGLAGQ